MTVRRLAALALLCVGLAVGARADGEIGSDARFHELLRAELRRRALLCAGCELEIAVAVAFEEAGHAGAEVAAELARDRDRRVAERGRQLLRHLAAAVPDDAPTRRKPLERGMVIRILPEGGLALQRARHVGPQHDLVLVGEPFPIEGTVGREHERLWAPDELGVSAADATGDFDPRPRRALACTRAAMASARTTVGLVLALRDEDPVRRQAAADALRILAAIRRDLEPECVTSSPVIGRHAVEAPVVRHQLEAAATDGDAITAGFARQALERLGPPDVARSR